VYIGVGITKIAIKRGNERDLRMRGTIKQMEI